MNKTQSQSGFGKVGAVSHVGSANGEARSSTITVINSQEMILNHHRLRERRAEAALVVVAQQEARAESWGLLWALAMASSSLRYPLWDSPL